MNKWVDNESCVLCYDETFESDTDINLHHPYFSSISRLLYIDFVNNTIKMLNRQLIELDTVYY